MKAIQNLDVEGRTSSSIQAHIDSITIKPRVDRKAMSVLGKREHDNKIRKEKEAKWHPKASRWISLCIPLYLIVL